MTKLICLMPVYNCADVVLEALKSIDGKVDEIFCIDGRWIGMEGSDYSTDETQKIILEFSMHSKSQVYYLAFSPMHQWQARNKSLKLCENGDWAIFLDSDEIVTEWNNDVRKTLENSVEKHYRMCWMRYRLNAAHLRYGVLRKTETLRWSKDHRRLYDAYGEIDIPNSPIIHIVLANNPLADKKQQRSNMNKYYKWLYEYENQSN